jgi:hypothetical protein
LPLFRYFSYSIIYNHTDTGHQPGITKRSGSIKQLVDLAQQLTLLFANKPKNGDVVAGELVN